MKVIATLVLIVGIALAGGAIYVTSQYIDGYERQLASTETATTRVLVARVDLERGTRLAGGTHLEFRDYPNDLVPERAFTDYDDLIGGRDGDTPMMLRDLEAGLPVLPTMLSGFNEDTRMAQKLKDGKRAFSIPINAITGVAGFIAPGDRVDILLTRRVGQQLESSIIMRNLLVIAVDQKTEGQISGPQTASIATVEVTTTQAQKLSVAQQLGGLSLTLRGLDETDTDDGLDTINVQDVLGIQEKKERVGNSVKVRKGSGEVESVTFE